MKLSEIINSEIKERSSNAKELAIGLLKIDSNWKNKTFLQLGCDLSDKGINLDFVTLSKLYEEFGCYKNEKIDKLLKEKIKAQEK